MNKIINFLVVGPGLIGKKHIELINDNKACHLEAVVTPCIEKYVLNGTCVYSEIKIALKSHHFDAVIISSPNEFHVAQAIECIDQGLPVLVEKPLASNINDAKFLVSYANKKGVDVLVGHHRTYSPYIASAKKIINSEKFGSLVSVQGSALFYKPHQYFLDGEWRTKLGGGPILINLIHEIGIMRELCGEIESVFAFSSNKKRRFEVEDSVAITFKFKNDCLGTFILSDVAASCKSWEMTSGENPSYPHFNDQSCYHFSGTNGSLDFPNMLFRYYPNIGKGSWWEPFESESVPVEIIDPLQAQLLHFIDVIEKKDSPLVSALSGLDNMFVIEAIRESILKEKVIYINGSTECLKK